MARKFLTNVDMTLNQIKNVILDIIAGNPISPPMGRIWYNDVEDRVFYMDNVSDRGIVHTEDAFSSGDLQGTVTTPTVKNDVITNAKLANMATQTFKGRTSAGSGDPEDLSIAQAKSLLDLSGSNSGDQTITLTGDVTGSGTGSFPTAIAAGAIVDADINAAAGIALSKLASDPLARANHTGTQLASTISDFDTQVRTNRLDQMAVPTGFVNVNGQRIINLQNPVVDNDGANKLYVDTVAQGLTAKPAVRVATTANITLSGTQTIDGVALIVGNRVLVKNQSSTAQNGIYVVSNTTWARASDMDDTPETKGAFVFVQEGSTQANTGWTQISELTILGTDPMVWVQFSGAGTYLAGAGLTLSGSTFAVGQGTGLTVNADDVALDTAYLDERIYDNIANSINSTPQDGITKVVNDGANETNLSVNIVPGGGLAFSSGAIEVDNSVIRGSMVASGLAQKYAVNNSAGTSTVVTHNFNTRDVQVTVYNATTYEEVDADVTHNSVNQVTVTFATSQSGGAFRIVVVG